MDLDDLIGTAGTALGDAAIASMNDPAVREAMARTSALILADQQVKAEIRARAFEAGLLAGGAIALALWIGRRL